MVNKRINETDDSDNEAPDVVASVIAKRSALDSILAAKTLAKTISDDKKRKRQVKEEIYKTQKASKIAKASTDHKSIEKLPQELLERAATIYTENNSTNHADPISDQEQDEENDKDLAHQQIDIHDKLRSTFFDSEDEADEDLDANSLHDEPPNAVGFDIVPLAVQSKYALPSAPPLAPSAAKFLAEQLESNPRAPAVIVASLGNRSSATYFCADFEKVRGFDASTKFGKEDLSMPSKKKLDL